VIRCAVCPPDVKCDSDASMSQIGPELEILVTGGAGFVGSSLAIGLKLLHPAWRVIAFDNLKRRGSELSLPRLRDACVHYVHGDVRSKSDLLDVGRFDVLVDCSAEPSVLAGLSGSPSYVVDTNLVGTLNCLDAVRVNHAGMVFLSTSRVYPIAAIERLPWRESARRYELEPCESIAGYSQRGISESFALDGARSIYGATKLCSELMIQEYVEAFDIPAVINRCGVLTGPWQMGRVDQGVIMHWVASHIFRRPLRYIGYGGNGKQVRDILHVDDLLQLVETQLAELPQLRGDIFNVGGGNQCSVSLLELTELCQSAAGNHVEIEGEAETRRADVRIYLTDYQKASQRFGFTPRATPAVIVEDIARWVVDHRTALESTLFGMR
jgi:CDP-paratose 2-epimerase